MNQIFEDEKPEVVVNLAAQAGVRYSLENPRAYIDSNIVGFMNILEGCRHHEVKHLIYASSSSVYGANTNKPFKTSDNIDHPLSLYAATKNQTNLWRILIATFITCQQQGYASSQFMARGADLTWHYLNSLKQ